MAPCSSRSKNHPRFLDRRSKIVLAYREMPANSAGAVEQQIADWIREHVVVSVAGRGRCRRIVLRHLNLENHPQGDVNSFNIPQDEGLAGETDMIVNRVVDAAQRDANDYEGGIQKYALFAYYTDDPNYVPRKIFRVAADDEVSRDVSPSEPPTEKGLVSQTMRHLEAVMKTATVSSGVIIENMTRQLRDHQESKKVNDQQTIDLMLLVQENINEAHRRRLDERREEMEMGIKEGLFEQLKVAIPIILNRISGKPLLPEQDKSFMLMAALLENLRPEQQAFLRESLDPPQAAVLGEILGEYEKKKASFMGGSQRLPGSGSLAIENSLPPPTGQGELMSMPPTSAGAGSLGKMFQNVRERTSTGADEESDDEVIRNLEKHGMRFMSRLAEIDKIKKEK